MLVLRNYLNFPSRRKKPREREEKLKNKFLIRQSYGNSGKSRRFDRCETSRGEMLKHLLKANMESKIKQKRWRLHRKSHCSVHFLFNKKILTLVIYSVCAFSYDEAALRAIFNHKLFN